MSTFAEKLIAWQRLHGRHDLPWQGNPDPYRVWLAEIMLQQTQVVTVIPYYLRFLARFPTLAQLAAARLDEVLALWSGLGYYARARNLHRCARIVIDQFHGRFPETPEALHRLPGIGRSTAHAIAVTCFGQRLPILDGNVKRVLCRFLGIEGFPGSARVEARLWEAATALLPTTDLPTYIQAQMDLGALVCIRARPLCQHCPLKSDCVALRENRTGILPSPRPTKTRPERHLNLLILVYRDQIVMETRPAAGIWGGLLSLPEFPGAADPVEYCRRHFGVSLGAVSPAPIIKHDLTHYRLRLHPWCCQVKERKRRPRQADWRWVKLDEIGQQALPAPIRRLLNGIP